MLTTIQVFFLRIILTAVQTLLWKVNKIDTNFHSLYHLNQNRLDIEKYGKFKNEIE